MHKIINGLIRNIQQLVAKKMCKLDRAVKRVSSAEPRIQTSPVSDH